MPSKRHSTGLTGLVILATWIYPIWPYEQALHNSLTFMGAGCLWWYLQKNTLTNHHFFLICLFLMAHSIAARWLYSYVPYDQWATQLWGTSFSEMFGWQRNHTDRVIHFLYGFCLTPAIVQHFTQRYQLPIQTGLKLAIGMIMVNSLCYEWFEWGVAMTLSPEDTEAYNGQQGDMWDAHKDMLCATLGSVMWWFKYQGNKTAV
jgi:putative membrane protein